MMESLLIVLGCLFALYGAMGLVVVWLFPRSSVLPVWGRGLLGRMEPTRRNRTLMCLWNLFFGAFIALSSSGHHFLGSVAAVAFLVVAVTSIVIRSGPASQA